MFNPLTSQVGLKIRVSKLKNLIHELLSISSSINLSHNLFTVTHYRRGLNMAGIDLLKRKIEIYQSEKVPGIISLYNIMCFKEYGSDCNTLLLSTPSRLVNIVRKIQRGDEFSLKIVFKLIYLTPIEESLDSSGLSERLWSFIERGEDQEFISLIKQLVKEKLANNGASGEKS